jgi:hypothetical protein
MDGNEEIFVPLMNVVVRMSRMYVIWDMLLMSSVRMEKHFPKWSLGQS